MKKYLIVAVLLAGLIGCSREPDVRNMRWGMSVDEVKEKEEWEKVSDGSLHKDGDVQRRTMKYKGKLSGRSASLSYGFRTSPEAYHNKPILRKAYYFMYNSDEKDYQHFLGLLRRKYGTPENFTRPATRDITEEYKGWYTENERTQVELELMRRGYTRTVIIRYIYIPSLQWEEDTEGL